MASEEADLEPYLKVGGSVVFHSDPFAKDAPRYPTVVRGWRKPSYILVDRPKVSERYVAIRENQSCVIRFVRDGKACAFDSLVLDWDTRQYNAYCRIEWPRSVKVVSFRRFERVRLELPCRAKVGGDVYPAQIQDLSMGGCRLSMNSPLDVGAQLELSFTLPDGTSIDSAECVVKNVQPSAAGGQSLIGCEFAEGQVCVEGHIAFHITTKLDRAGLRDPRIKEILVIDENPARVAALRGVFQDRGYEALIAAETLDGLVRLRASVPDALLVNQNQKELSGLVIARLVVMTRGLESLPVFLYDNADTTVQEQAVKAGLAGCFRRGTPPNEIVNTVVTCLVGALKSKS